jgi:mono/diheme cytochrome c family protein
MAVLLGVFALVAVGLVIRAKWILGRSYTHIPHVPIIADRSDAGVRRGEMLFQALCIECHGGADGRATGKHLDEVPAFLGTFYSANLAHPERGVHRRTDGAIARTLRAGVLPDGRFSPLMANFSHIGDADVAALLGYLRSAPPALVPGGVTQPPSELSLVGELIVTVIAGVQVGAPRTGVPVPKRAPTVEYGRYMAEVMDCLGCHTEGFSSEKMKHPGAFAGGFEFTDPTGAKIWSKNITPDEATGIGRWSVDDFERALTRGVTPQGYVVRRPMPLFARFERVEVEAIYRFLRTVPEVNRPNVPGGHPLHKARPNDSPEVLFVNVGCAACHGKSAPFHSKIRGALEKSDTEVAAWILDPQSFRPGSSMPSFQHTLDRSQAERLAKYVKSLASATDG